MTYKLVPDSSDNTFKTGLHKEKQMVSMVIVLFLVAVAISLFVGRLAEILMNRIKERSQPRQARKRKIARVSHAPGKIA